MNEPREMYTLDRIVRMVLSLITLVAVFALLRYLSDVLLPFAVAVVLAYLLNPLVGVFERKTKRRSLAVGMTVGGLGVIGLAVVAIAVPLMAGQIDRFQHDLGTLRDDLMESMVVESVRPNSPTAPTGKEAKATQPTDGGTSLGFVELTHAWTKYREHPDVPRHKRLANLLQSIEGTHVGDLVGRARRYVASPEFDQFLLDAAKRLALGGLTVVTFAVNVILGMTGLIVVLLYLVFLLMDFPEYARTWQTFLPPTYRGPIVEFLGQFDDALRRYLRGQSAVAGAVGVLFAIGFSIVGLPMALPFGLFIGLLNMVPYLQMAGIVPALMLAGLRSIEGDASFAASVLLTLLVFAVVQLIQDAIIIPRIMGKATGLRPVAILLGVFIWGKLLGFLGLLLAIPLTCLGVAYYRRMVLQHQTTPESQ